MMCIAFSNSKFDSWFVFLSSSSSFGVSFANRSEKLTIFLVQIQIDRLKIWLNHRKLRNHVVFTRSLSLCDSRFGYLQNNVLFHNENRI